MIVLHKRTVLIICVLVVSLTNVVGNQCQAGFLCVELTSCSGLYKLLLQNNTDGVHLVLRYLQCGFGEQFVPKVCCHPKLMNSLTVATTQASAVDPPTLLANAKSVLTIKGGGIQNNNRTTEREKQCQGGAPCIELQSCIGFYEMMKKGNTTLLNPLLITLECDFGEQNQRKVCCPREFKNSLHNLTTQANAFDPLSLLPTNKVCGIQNKDRILGGVRTDIDEHPWMALLRYNKPSGSGFHCGGVLISSRYVLTAAHCNSPLPYRWKLSQVRLGEWDMATTLDCIEDDCSPPPLDVPIEQIIMHELYDTEDSNQLYDIALLRLSMNVNFSDFVKPICLPLSDEFKKNNFIGQNMEVAGWGKTENTSESEVKLKTTVPVVPNSQCANVFQKVNREIKDTQICAGGVGGRDSCRGDSGGPLMSHLQATNWVAVGLVSYGPNPCGIDGWPGVYTKVGAYVDWILSKLRP